MTAGADEGGWRGVWPTGSGGAGAGYAVWNGLLSECMDGGEFGPTNPPAEELAILTWLLGDSGVRSVQEGVWDAMECTV